MKTFPCILVLCLLVAGREISSSPVVKQIDIIYPADETYPDLQLPPVSKQF